MSRYKLAANGKKEPDDESLPRPKHKRARLCLPTPLLLKMAKLTKKEEKEKGKIKKLANSSPERS